ncbi:hypothetical protein COCOBI_01-4280 [Coccomyxa sp. Obi]|nr:hypothetical protein COCOBI_01-4280 [Coccomyxa sp. Obi]
METKQASAAGRVSVCKDVQPLPKAVVKVPKCGKGKTIGSVQQAPGRRRSASSILEQHKQLQAELSCQMQPPQKALGEAEKSRLAKHMEFRGHPPDAAANENENPMKTRGRRASREGELENLFEEVAREIGERQEHLEYAMGRGSLKIESQAVRQLQSEIASRRRELRRIHELILSETQPSV